MLLSVRLRLSQRLKLMLVFCMEPMATVPVLDMLVLATMARGLLMLSQRLMLVCITEDMDMVLVWDMLDLDMDIPVLDMLDMVVMDSDTVLDMDVSSMVKQLSYASRSSKVIFLLFYSVPSCGVGSCFSCSDVINMIEKKYS